MDRTKNHQFWTSPWMRGSHSLLGASAGWIALSRVSTAFLVGALALLAAPGAGYAANISVCTSGCNQTNVAAAVQAANPGDTVVIGAGTFTANLVIAKNLTLQGAGAGQTILDGGLMYGGVGSVSSTITVQTGANVSVQGLTITRGVPAGIVVGGTLTISDSVITQNPVGISNGGYLTVLRTMITGNSDPRITYPEAAGGILAQADSITNLFDSAVVNNAGLLAGGIAIAGGNVSLTNTTVSSNTGIDGNNIMFTRSSGYPQGVILVNSTVVNPKSSTSPSIGSEDPSIAATLGLIVGNTVLDAGSGSNCSAGFAATSGGHNLSSDNSCNLDDPSDLVNNQAIYLGPLQVHAPGATASHVPQIYSAAIDAGDCAAGLEINDQRGVARPQGPACDIGAVEVQIPDAANYAYATSAGKTLAVPAPGLFANALSPEGFALSIANPGTPSHGTLYLFPDGSFQYVPSVGFVGQDSFTYSLSDGVHQATPATVSINVTASNYPPVAANDSYSVVEAGRLQVTAAQGVLANDKDPDGDPITAVLVAGASYGGLVLNPDGSFLYVPKPGFIGTDTFTYAASDGQALSNAATATITVMPNYGTITIDLSTLPQNPQAFNFNSSFGSFSLGGINPSSKTFQANAGTWTFTETRPKPWLMYNILCTTGPGVLVDLNKNYLQIALVGSENITCTFVNALPSQITVRAFHDLNADGKREKGEPFLGGITVQLYTNPYNLVKTAVLDSTGKAAFGNLWPQVYTVCEVLPARWTTTNPPVIDPTYGKPCFTLNATPGATVPVLFGLNK